MKDKILHGLLGAAIAIAFGYAVLAVAGQITGNVSISNANSPMAVVPVYQDTSGNWQAATNVAGSVSLSTLISGEDQTLGRLFGGPKANCASYTADGVIKASAGMLVSITVTNASANDDVIIYDNASAASGTKLTDLLNLSSGTTVIPNYPAIAGNGMYLDLTTAGTIHVDICYL